MEFTTSTMDAADRGGLTYDKLMAVLHDMEQLRPTLCYIASDYVPIQDDGRLMCINNQGATTLGYDVLCHTSQLPAMLTELSGRFNLKPLDGKEFDRRSAPR